MTTQPQRPDLARTLVDRAERARAHRALLVCGLLSPTEINMERHVDRADAQVLRRIVTDHGWPGKTLVGEHGAKAAWHLALHADHDLDLQQLALGLLAGAVEEGEATIQQWAASATGAVSTPDSRRSSVPSTAAAPPAYRCCRRRTRITSTPVVPALACRRTLSPARPCGSATAASRRASSLAPTTRRGPRS